MIVRLEKIVLENFLSWRTLEWAPAEEVNCLIGLSDAGKTNLLRAFEFVADSCSKPIVELFPEEHSFRSLVTAGAAPMVSIRMEGLHKFDRKVQPFAYYLKLVQPTLGVAAKVGEEMLAVGDHRVTRDGKHLQLRYPGQEDGQVETRLDATITCMLLHATALDHDAGERLIRDPLRAVAIDFSNFLRLRLIAEAIREPCPLRLSRPNLQATGRNLANLLARLAHNPEGRSTFDAIRRHLEQLLPSIRDLGTRAIERDGIEEVLLRFQGVGGDGEPFYFDADKASDGLLYITALMTLSRLPNSSGVTLLEEPENGLHPVMVEQVIQMLKQYVADSGQQVFLTTHSPIVLNLLEPENVWITLRAPTGCSELHRMSSYHDLDRWRDNFGAGEIWQTLGEVTLAQASNL